MRPFKEGLDYFEMDCHLDEKVRFIQAEFGLKGFAVVVLLYKEIYGGQGYYMSWDEDRLLLFMLDNGVAEGDKNLIQEIVSACIRRNIFSERIFQKYRILTSSGIQKRYLNAVARRGKVEMKKEYLLVDVDKNKVFVSKNPVNVNNNPVNDDRNSQSREEKSREEKRNSNSAPKARGPTATEIIKERHFGPAMEPVVLEWVAYKTEKRQAYKETGLKNLLTQIENKIVQYGEAPVIEVIRLSMSQNWQGIIWDRISPARPAAAPQTGYDPKIFDQLANESHKTDGGGDLLNVR